MKQFLLHLDEKVILGKKFVIDDLDETHLFVSAEIVPVLQEKVWEIMDNNSFNTAQVNWRWTDLQEPLVSFCAFNVNHLVCAKADETNVVHNNLGLWKAARLGAWSIYEASWYTSVWDHYYCSYCTNERSDIMIMVNVMVPTSDQLEPSNMNLLKIWGWQMANVWLCELARHVFIFFASLRHFDFLKKLHRDWMVWKI